MVYGVRRIALMSGSDGVYYMCPSCHRLERIVGLFHVYVIYYIYI